jgi:hypothetical protein
MLLAYRAICFELFVKHAVVQAAPATAKLLQRGISEADQKLVARALSPFHDASELGLRDLMARKAELDADVASLKNRVLGHLVLRFAGDPIVAFSGGFTPDADLDGMPLQDFTDVNGYLEPVMLNLVPAEGESVLVISWRRASAIGRQFVESLLKAPRAVLSEWAPQLGFLFLENTYFSQRWWETRREYVRRHLINLAGTWGPTESKQTLLERNVSGWRLTSIKMVPDA